MPGVAAASIDPRLGIATAVCGERPGARRDVPEVWILGIDGNRPGVVAVPALVGRAPGCAAVTAPRGPAAACLVRPTGCARMPGERVDVALGARAMVFPRLAAVGRAHQAAELDPDEDESGLVRARRDPADVRRPGTRRE